MALFREGNSTEEIAEIRGLAAGTIEGHLGSAISFGKLELADVVNLPEEELEEIREVLRETEGLKAAYDHFKEKYSYGTLKCVGADMEYREKRRDGASDQ